MMSHRPQSGVWSRWQTEMENENVFAVFDTRGLLSIWPLLQLWRFIVSV